MRTSALRDRYAPPTSGGAQGALPQYILDRWEKARAFSDSAAIGPHHNLESAIAKLQGAEASLRLCADTIEGAVLALGVPTTHYLIAKLNETREQLRVADAAWRESTLARREEIRLNGELFDSMVSSHNSLRERNEAAEREARRLTEEHDRKNGVADRATQYLHSVIAERAKWQERCGHNVLDLPLEESTYAARTVEALDALREIRKQDLATDLARSAASAALTPAVGVSQTSLARGLVLSPTLPAPRSTGISLPPANATLNTSGGAIMAPLTVRPPLSTTAGALQRAEATAAAASQLSSSPHLPLSGSLAAQDSALLARLRGLANTRASSISPSVRLHYIPPREEIELLREVLDMGTGSTVLMTDIVNARDALERRRALVTEECATMQAALRSLRHELDALRRQMHEWLSQGIPFLSMKEELLQVVQQRVEKEARELAQLWITDMASDIDGAAYGRYATVNIGITGAAADIRSSTVSRTASKVGGSIRLSDTRMRGQSLNQLNDTATQPMDGVESQPTISLPSAASGQRFRLSLESGGEAFAVNRPSRRLQDGQRQSGVVEVRTARSSLGTTADSPFVAINESQNPFEPAASSGEMTSFSATSMDPSIPLAL